MLIPDLQGSLATRMATLTGILKDRTDLILVGSSFGGLMATIYAMANEADINRIVLLAPALNFPDFLQYPKTRIAVPTWMFIGSADTDFHLESGEEAIVSYSSSPDFRRDFCGRCGSPVANVTPGRVGVPAGLFDDEPPNKPTMPFVQVSASPLAPKSKPPAAKSRR